MPASIALLIAGSVACAPQVSAQESAFIVIEGEPGVVVESVDVSDVIVIERDGSDVARSGPQVTRADLLGFSQAHFDAMIGILVLDADQIEGVELLADAARVECAEIIAARSALVQDAIERLEDAPDWGALSEAVDEIMSGHAESIANTRASFLEDVQLLLSPGQVEQWPAYERAARRIDHLKGGEFAGEGVDLFELFESVQPGETSRALALEVFEEYELAVDEKIRAREKAESQAISIKEAMTTLDIEKLTESQKPVREASHELAKLNRTYAERLADAVGSEDGEALRTAFRKASYPALFTSRYPETLLERLEAEPTLTEHQAAQVEQIGRSYLTKRGRFIDQQIRAQHDFERDMLREGKRRGPRTVTFSFTWKDGEAAEKLVEASYVEIMDLRRERGEMEDQVVDRLFAVLDIDQRAQMPQRRTSKFATNKDGQVEYIKLTGELGEAGVIEIVKQKIEASEGDGEATDEKDETQ